MKKTTRLFIVFSLVVVFSLAFSGSVLAGKGGNPKGTVTAIDEAAQTMTLETDSGTVTVYLPDGFDYSSIAVDMYVVVRGDWDGEDAIFAVTVRETTPEDETEEPDEGDVEEPEEGDDDDAGDDSDDDAASDNGNHQNVYCTGNKDKVHPMATGIAEKYGADEGEIMNMICEGYSVGEIMLALQTQEMNGSPAADSLAARAGGKGWGQIWKDAGLIGNADAGTPPGQADKPLNPGHGGTPPGQDKDKKTPPGQDKKNDPGGDDDV
jgi:hypothetical protein